MGDGKLSTIIYEPRLFLAPEVREKGFVDCFVCGKKCDTRTEHSCKEGMKPKMFFHADHMRRYTGAEIHVLYLRAVGDIFW